MFVIEFGLLALPGFLAKKEEERAAEYEERCRGCPPERPHYYGNETSYDIMNKENRYGEEIRRCESNGCRM